MVHVYAVCRKCAEVHVTEVACPRCARRALVAKPGTPLRAVASPPAARAEAALADEIESTAAPPLWRLSTAVVGAYVLVVVGLIAAVLLDI